MNRKPTFFISSTIYDFRDLRSAIKFYLEEQGCAVLASEFNDFGQTLDQHSYDACLKQIEAADYFVLLIGARVGGWYNKDNRVSITRQEYRTAYRLHSEGKLKVIVFVRSEVWSIKDDRKELINFLDELDVDPGIRASIASRPSKAASDAKFLIEFLEEVGHNKETAKAVKSSAPLPTGNWIHVFSNFREVIDTLRAQVFAGRPIEQAINRQLLRNELLDVVSQLLMKPSDGKAISPSIFLTKFAKKYPITTSQIGNKTIITRRHWDVYLTCLMHYTRNRRPQLQILSGVLASDTFLEYDRELGIFRELPEYRALSILQDEVRSLIELKTGADIGTKMVSLSIAARRGEDISIPIDDLILMQSLANRVINIILLATALIRYLDGGLFKMPVLQPQTPITDQVTALDEERVTVEEAARFVAADSN